MQMTSKTVLVLCALFTVFIFSCEFLYHSGKTIPERPQRPPLSEKAQKVVMRQGDQASTLELNEKCSPDGGIRTFKSEYDMRIAAAASSVDTVQILYTSSYTTGSYNNNSITSYSVRFWKCQSK